MYANISRFRLPQLEDYVHKCNKRVSFFLHVNWSSKIQYHVLTVILLFRLKLAAFHYNENCEREVLVEEGTSDPKLRVEYKKYLGGQGRAVKVRFSTTNGKNIFFTECKMLPIFCQL